MTDPDTMLRSPSVGPSPVKGERTPLVALLVEDRVIDAEIVTAELRRSGFDLQWSRVDNEVAYRAALATRPDIILSDFAMPQFDGLRALEILQETGADIPFIIISGTIGEETAVEAMRRGAADYLLKDRLARLGKAVTNALAESKFRLEREQNIAKLKHSEERLAAAQALARVGSWEFSYGDGNLIWSDQLYTIFGRDRQLGPPRSEEVRSWVHPGDQPLYDEDIRRCRDLGEGCHSQYRMFRHDGELVWVDVRTDVEKDAAGRNVGISGITQDITERRIQEEALGESEARLRQIAENIQEVIWMTDVIRRESLYISPQYEQLWGRTVASYLADPMSWLASVHPDDRDRITQAVLERETGQPYDETYRISRPDGEMRWIRDRAFPIRNPEGRVYRMVGSAMDITEQRKLEEQLLRAQRLEAIGNLSTGIAHDLNNILAPTLMVTSILRDKMLDPHDVELLSLVEQGAQRGAGIIKQLLTFSRGVSGSRGIVEMKHVLREMSDIMRETFPRDIKVVETFAKDLVPVVADATQIHQVLMNLCVNARDAMPQGGRISLAAQNIVIDEAEAKLHPPAKPGRYAVLSVADTGEGIPPEAIDRIFEPFYTTKQIGKGTGLGLSSVAGIIRSHGGFVTVFSKVGVGSLFKIHIPAAGDHPAAAPPAGSPELPLGQGQSILVVDDEAAICLAASRTLRKHNYRVVTANNGQAALGIFLEEGSNIDLLMTDLMMPVMGGVALIRSLRSLKPSLRVLATTGLDEKSNRDDLTALGISTLLAKPYSAEQLLQAVAEKFSQKP